MRNTFDWRRTPAFISWPLVALLFVLAAPFAAAAQDGAQTSNLNAQGSQGPQGPQGPMTVERVKSGFLVAPDFKVTNVDHRTSQLAGLYAGVVTDSTLFIGGGGYWLANNARDREMAYGGLVVGWLARTDRPFGFGAKALVGGGQATLSSPFGDIFGVGIDRDGRPIPSPTIAKTPVRFHQGFFVFEPEVNLLVNLTRHVRFTTGVGYRLTSDTSGPRGTGDRLRGVSGSVGLQIGGGS